MKSIRTLKLPSATLVRILPIASSMFKISAFCGFPIALLGPQAMASEKTTGPNRGREVFGAPPSGASMIHSTEAPAKLAPGGGASVRGKYWRVVALAK
jgi:hypothetical protein